MVSLFDISIQKPLWSHLSTGVPTLDQMLRLQNEALFDMQSVPANVGFSAMACSAIVSHLRSSATSKIIVLETLNAFSWHTLQQHPEYDATWSGSGKIVTYTVNTFAKLYAFFALGPIQKAEPGSVLILVTNFHELLEFYRLQISATHEEFLLRHQMEKNACYVENIPKASEEGLRTIELPQIPPIARDNPYTKVQNHINGLVSMMSDFAFNNSAVILLMSHLEPRFRQIPRTDPALTSDSSFQSSQPALSSAQNWSFYSKQPSRLMLTPVSFGQSSGEKSNLAESKITARLVFYNDWYYKSPRFKREHKRVEKRHRFLVSVAKVFNLNGINNINEPVYFHYKRLPSDLQDGVSNQTWLIDLSEPEESDALSALIQNSISSTQIPNREPTLRLDSNGYDSQIAQKRKVRKISMPSSPPPLEHILDFARLNETVHNGEGEADIGADGGLDDGETENDSAKGSDNELENDSVDDTDSDSDNGSNNDSDSGDESDNESDTGSGNDENSHEGGKESNHGRHNEEVSRALEDGPPHDIPKLHITDDHEDSFIEGSDVESTGTLFEDMDNSQPEWMMRHS